MKIRHTALAAFISVIGIVAVAITPASATPFDITVDAWLHDPFTVSVDGMQSVEELKAQVETQTGQPAADQCLLLGVTKLRDGMTLADMNVQPGDTINEWPLPVTTFWGITPEDPQLGRITGNDIRSRPQGRFFVVVDGTLPVGVILDENTGGISGRFDKAGPFDVTIGVQTDCGDGTIQWSGTVPDELANTGIEMTDVYIAVGVTVLVAIGGGMLVARRRRAS